MSRDCGQPDGRGTGTGRRCGQPDGLRGCFSCGSTTSLMVLCQKCGSRNTPPPTGAEYPGATGRRGEVGVPGLPKIRRSDPALGGLSLACTHSHTHDSGAARKAPTPRRPHARRDPPPNGGGVDLREPHSRLRDINHAVPPVLAAPSQAVGEPHLRHIRTINGTGSGARWFAGVMAETLRPT